MASLTGGSGRFGKPIPAKCARCKAEPDYLPTWQAVKIGDDRHDLCEHCYDSLRRWYNRPAPPEWEGGPAP